MSKTVSHAALVSDRADLPVASGSADLLGVDGVYFDPLWRVRVVLPPLEMALLDTWWHCLIRGGCDGWRSSLTPAASGAPLTSPSITALQHELPIWFTVEPRPPTVN